MVSSPEPGAPPGVCARIPFDFLLGEIRLLRVWLKGEQREGGGVFDEPFDTIPVPKRTDPAPAVYLYSLPVTRVPAVLTRREGWYLYTPSWYRHYYLRTNLPFDRYVATLGAKTRSTLRRKLRRIAATNRAGTFRVFSTPERMAAFHEQAASLAATTYQHRLFGTGLPAHNDYREQITALARRGEFYGFILYVNDRPAAYTACPVIRPHVALYDYTGYDPVQAVFSPGIVLQYSIIEYFCGNPAIEWYDLCTGEGEHKTLFTSTWKLCCNTYLLRASVPALLLVSAHRVLNAITTAVAALLDSMRLKGRVKRLVRRGG